jgi:hypothetical protein
MTAETAVRAHGEALAVGQLPRQRRADDEPSSRRPRLILDDLADGFNEAGEHTPR